MNLIDLLGKGYFPKELPPCFHTSIFATNYANIKQDASNNENVSSTLFINTVDLIGGLTRAQKAEEKIKYKQIFKNRLSFSDAVQFSIPKSGLSRNVVKITNPIHQGKLADVISANYGNISLLFSDSIFSTTKPQIETENGESKRAVKHENYGYFKEKCVVDSFKYAIQLKTDIAKYYPSIYTHSVPWVTFGGKSLYKRNRDLHRTDTARVNSIYGDEIDDRLMWCQNQQTIGIPIGPDTSFIIAEIVACHLDKLLNKQLQKKKIDFLAYRYYDDYYMYFNNELDAQIGLSEFKNILNDFELKTNDSKTIITKTQNELEKEWALDIKSFFFRPSKNDQRDDIWNFFSIAFKHSIQNPNDSVLKLALNKFNYVRIEKENWDFFESLVFRLGLVETSALQKVAKILITYKGLVNKTKLKDFCFEIISRHYENNHDYELTWALWILKEFNIQPTKDIFLKIFSSNCVCSSIISLNLLSKNNRIKNFDYSKVSTLISTENLNTKYWLLTYEAIFNNWISTVPITILTGHFYFNILNNYGVNFYDENKKLEPLKVENTYLNKIERKLIQLNNYLKKNKINNDEIIDQISVLTTSLSITSLSNQITRNEIRKRLTASEKTIIELLEKTEIEKDQLKKFEKKKPYFVVGKRLEELGFLTSKEIQVESKQDKDLLFDPDYE
ncbi:RNA-directed DNA polymerase [Flavobacterium aquidurense]|uniref:RNA-directed DNA polymerase n=1 Tax=Flavobacterium aquidurense TaxID=362413 RepID=UPI00375749C8